MTTDLRITVVQPDIIWKNPTENLNRYQQILTVPEAETDLILLPEMFQTGFCTDPAGIAEPMNGPTIRWMKRIAEKLGCAIAGSLIIRDGRRYFNRLIYMDQYENMTWYDKRHLFRIEDEESTFTAGSNRLIMPLKGWRICFQICYDLRFPVWSRNQDDYDVLVYLANWPAARTDVWKTLLKARAIENQAYVTGVNRVGTDGNNIVYSGNTITYSPKGEILGELPDSLDCIETQSLSWDALDDFRKKFPVWKDRDDFVFSR